MDIFSDQVIKNRPNWHMDRASCNKWNRLDVLADMPHSGRF